VQNMRFEAALQNMSRGLAMFDREQRLVICNDEFGSCGY
jgi:PAS fold